MPKIRNVSPYGDLETPLLHRIVKAGETVTVSDEHAEVLLAQFENWAPADKAAQKVADSHSAAQAAREREGRGVPKTDALKAEWVVFAQAQGDLDAESKTKSDLIAEHGSDPEPLPLEGPESDDNSEATS